MLEHEVHASKCQSGSNRALWSMIYFNDTGETNI